MSKEQTTDVAKAEPTYSQRFTAMVVREFSQELGTLQMTPYQERLAQHLFIGVDISLKKLEADRLKKDVKKLPIVWTNVNMEKLAIDAVHRVELGLDALIPNHIHTIPYLNGKTGKYDLDLQIGYVGKDYYKRKMALVTPKDIIYRLVYKNDAFKPKMKTLQNPESYDFQVPKPFDRGEVVGGFGYIEYDDPTLNRLIIVSKASFDKSQKKAQSDAFWGPYTEEMQMVALVRRVTAKLNIDPRKVNVSYLRVEVDEAALLQIEENANQDIIDVDTEPEDKGKGEKGKPLVEETNEAKAKKKKSPEKEGAKNEGNQFVYCPIQHRRVAIANCETNKCGKFLSCDTVQDKIAKLMEEERIAAATEGPEGPHPGDPGPDPGPAF